MIERYTSKEMKSIWSLENRYNNFLKIELNSLKALVSLGIVPLEDYLLIEKKAKFSVARINELELITKHDVIAFTRCVDEALGDEKKWFHYGLTSTDIVDSALALTLKDTNNILEEKINNLLVLLKNKALEYKLTPCIGRTHGIHAEVTTFGLKWLNWYDELIRGMDCFKIARNEVESIKISGAVGNYVSIPLQVEELVGQYLNINYAKISTQVNSRDKIANYIFSLARISSLLEKIAIEVRTLSRTEINEVNEYFQVGQKGSSAMPHKKNPISSENICGIARVMRSYINPSLEDNCLWSERDISHSSVERIILPDACTLLDYMLSRYTKVLAKLTVNKEVMLENINKTNGVVFSGRVLNKILAKNALSREEVYDLIQKLAFISINEKIDFKELLINNNILNYLTKEELDECFSIEFYLRNVEKIYERFNLL